MMMKAGMRMRSGISRLSSEMTRLEHISTNVVARPMPRPLTAAVVMASVGHMPSTRRKVGFSVTRPFVTIRFMS